MHHCGARVCLECDLKPGRYNPGPEMPSTRLNPAFASTEDVAAAAGGVTRHTLRRWCERGVLPKPTLYGIGRGGTHNRWPAWAVARARWVRGMLDEGHTLDEVAAQATTLGDRACP